MKCYVCSEDNWHLFAHEFTGWPDRQLGVCRTCAAVAYQVENEEEPKMREYYRKDYRGQIGPSNLQTTSRKLNYIKNFIGPFIEEREKAGQKLIVGDVGCATGYIVNWFRDRGHKATGSEWTITMRRFAEHFYGLPITEELPDKHKYDFIVMYHTFEHMIDPKAKLEKYKNMLADDGHMLIATPEWLDVMDESGAGKIVSFKELYNKNHINIFTYNSLNAMFANAGLVVVKEDKLVYGQSYILRKAKPGEVVKVIHKEDWQEIVKKIEDQKKAIELFKEACGTQGKELLFREALNVWPKFPDVYYEWVLNSTLKKDRGRCAELIEEAFNIMPWYPKINIVRGYFLYQNQEWVPALEDFDYLSKTKVNGDILMFKGYCLYHLGRGREAMNAFHEASVLDPLKWGEASVWMCRVASEMPNWQEVAEQKVKDQLFQQAKVKVEPKDPIFEENGNGNKKVEEVKKEILKKVNLS